MKKARAIISDEGGLTSHSAIVSRELKIPCIVGVQVATSLLKDGDVVLANANDGSITVLSRQDYA
jgi:pyruvate,water dikinase